MSYSRPWHSVIVGGQLDAGNDVYGANFARLSAFVRYDNQGRGLAASLLDAMGGAAGEQGSEGKGVEYFVDAGVNRYKRDVDLVEETLRTTDPTKDTEHFAVGVRRAASERNVLPGWDIGADLRYDDSIARDRVLPGEPVSPTNRPDSFYDITSVIVSISRHF